MYSIKVQYTVVLNTQYTKYYPRLAALGLLDLREDPVGGHHQGLEVPGELAVGVGAGVALHGGLQGRQHGSDVSLKIKKRSQQLSLSFRSLIYQ